MSILVVDDNTMLLRKIVRSFAIANHQVHSASSIKQACEMLKQHTPQVMCLDIQLPDGNGLDLLDELRRDGSDIPVVIISGHNSAENRVRAAQLGAAGFIAKPFALSGLHALLEKLLSSTTGDSGVASSMQLDETPVNTPDKANIMIKPLSPLRIGRAKWAYTTHRVPAERAVRLITGKYTPKVGDLVLAKIDKLNQHKRLELANGRRATLFVDDEIVVCYGNRYAPDQFEAEIPSDLSSCNLVAAGGVAALSLSRNSKIHAATRITPVGVLADVDGHSLNLCQFGLETRRAPQRRPVVTAVIGTSMNAGKTTTLAGLSLGMTRMGLKVGTAKVTGTGAGGDVWHMIDAGSHAVFDFTDGGVPSTYKLSIETCEKIMETLVAHLCDAEVDTILLEVADGILQEETRKLIQSPVFENLVDNIVFAAGSALGAASGVSWLREQGFNVIGISGALTCAPLAVRECEGLIDLPIVDRETLHRGQWQLDAIGVSGERSKNPAETALVNSATQAV